MLCRRAKSQLDAYTTRGEMGPRLDNVLRDDQSESLLSAGIDLQLVDVDGEDDVAEGVEANGSAKQLMRRRRRRDDYRPSSSASNIARGEERLTTTVESTLPAVERGRDGLPPIFDRSVGRREAEEEDVPPLHVERDRDEAVEEDDAGEGVEEGRGHAGHQARFESAHERGGGRLRLRVELVPRAGRRRDPFLFVGGQDVLDLEGGKRRSVAKDGGVLDVDQKGGIGGPALDRSKHSESSQGRDTAPFRCFLLDPRTPLRVEIVSQLVRWTCAAGCKERAPPVHCQRRALRTASAGLLRVGVTERTQSMCAIS